MLDTVIKKGFWGMMSYVCHQFNRCTSITIKFPKTSFSSETWVELDF